MKQTETPNKSTQINQLNNLYHPTISKQKGQQNEIMILKFLLTEKYSTSDVLRTLLNLKTQSPVYKILKRLEQKGFVKKHKLNAFVTIFGITFEGLCEAQSELEKMTEFRYFELSKFNLLTLEHTLITQKIHVICNQLDLDFTPGSVLGSRANADKIADGIIEIGQHKIALEVECHVKSRKRYDAIIYHYLKLIKAEKYSFILYVSPTKNKANTIKKTIESLEKITMKVNGKNQMMTLNPETHLSYFDFISIENAKQNIQDLINFFNAA